MSTVTLSDNFELPVPDDVRELLQLKAGAQFRVIPYAGRLEFVPIRKPSDLRGFVRGMDTSSIERDDEDRPKPT
jgi:bifunctional DNA-binding transcriptional regulator/antitoxin component of YhaV-PrlF toxin-antitoxin module